MHKNHDKYTRDCLYCNQELLDDQGKVVFALHSRLDYLWEQLPGVSNKPDEVKRFLMSVEDKFPLTGAKA